MNTNVYSSAPDKDLSLPHATPEAALADITKQVLSETDIDRIIEMAWEDRTPFEAIFFQFGLKESEVKALMKSQLKFSSYKMWRKRVEASHTKHAGKRVDGISRFKSKLQRVITYNKISKRSGR